MLFKSALVTSASGSVGGMTASHNRGGMYLRARAIPVNMNTAAQQVARAALSAIAAAWGSVLSESERDGWETYATNVPVPNALGDSHLISGQQAFARNNGARVRAGLARVDTAPVIYTEPSLTLPVPAPAAGAPDIPVSFTNTDSWATAVGGALLVFAGRERGPGVNFYKGPFRYAGRINGAVVPPASPATLSDPYGISYTEGNKVWYRFVAVTADGRISSERIVETTVAP